MNNKIESLEIYLDQISQPSPLYSGQILKISN